MTTRRLHFTTSQLLNKQKLSLVLTIEVNSHAKVMFLRIGYPGLFLFIFALFKQILQKKLKTSAGFELGSLE